MVCGFVFFFSSRRRHTRCGRDWSSDVCSSDLEYPAIYHKDRVLGALRKPRPGETEEQSKARGGREIATLLESPFFDVWARAGIAEIISGLHERLVTA